MSGVQWVRLDTQFAGNPKLLALTQGGRWRSAFVYVASLAYAGGQGTDGYIPEAALSLIQANRSNAVDLVKAGLWEQDVHGWRTIGAIKTCATRLRWHAAAKPESRRTADGIRSDSMTEPHMHRTMRSHHAFAPCELAMLARAQRTYALTNKRLLSLPLREIVRLRNTRASKTTAATLKGGDG